MQLTVCGKNSNPLQTILSPCKVKPRISQRGSVSTKIHEKFSHRFTRIEHGFLTNTKPTACGRVRRTMQ